MGFQQSCERSRSEQRRVGAQDHDRPLGPGDRVGGLAYGMAGAELFGLQHDLGLVVLHCAPDAVRLVSEDQHGPFRPKGSDCLQYMLDERLSREQMERFGSARPHAGPQARRKNDDRGLHAPPSPVVPRFSFNASRSLRETSPREMMNFIPCSTDMSRG